MDFPNHPPVSATLAPLGGSLTSQAKWREYLSQRKGTYEFRCRRYAAVAEKLVELGLDESHVLMDFGAGQTEFDFFLRTELGWRGYMNNVDGAIDGSDLNTYFLKGMSDYTACIEVIEHLKKPGEMVAKLEGVTRHGLVFTTPNPDVVDVLAMDETHSAVVSLKEWHQMYYETELLNLFGNEGDTILAWKYMRE